MELRQLEYFLAVAEEGNFTRAAERVHISQSGVSAQIQQLERDLGATLLDRSGRRATLTVAGATALPHARAALASVATLRQMVDDVTGLLRGRLVVGMVTGCTVTPLFDALAAFHTAHPGVEITLLEDSSDRLVERVRAGTADVALVGAAGTLPAGLDGNVIVSEGLVALVTGGHPVAGQRRVTLAELAAYPIICMPEGTGIRTVFDRSCAAHGMRPMIALQASAADAIADLARRGLGVGVLAATMAADYPDLTAVPLDDVEIPALLALVWAPAPSPALPLSPALRELLIRARTAFAGGGRPGPLEEVAAGATAGGVT
jgi:DNA-binding transcriptional LysR family regulator